MDYKKAKSIAMRNVQKQITESTIQIEAVKEGISDDKPISIKLDALHSNASLVFIELNRNYASGFVEEVKEFISEVLDIAYQLGKKERMAVNVVPPEISKRDVTPGVKIHLMKKEMYKIFYQGGCDKTSPALINKTSNIIRDMILYAFNLGCKS